MRFFWRCLIFVRGLNGGADLIRTGVHVAICV
jgi:hypothetical protein